jgi:uncharacterized membrane protein YidH (DUF202 family)
MMQENRDRDDDGALATIQALMARSVELQEKGETLEEEIADLARRRTEGTSGLLQFASAANTYSEKQTDMAAERTALTREQTRLSTRSTELSNIRTDFARERTSLAGQRTDLAVRRTGLSDLRTELAWGRTYLALIRTGLAFLVLGISLFRYFGLSWWSLFDGLLALGSAVIVIWGGRGYQQATVRIRKLTEALNPRIT